MFYVALGIPIFAPGEILDLTVAIIYHARYEVELTFTATGRSNNVGNGMYRHNYFVIISGVSQYF